MNYTERLNRGILTHREWADAGYVVGNGQYSSSRWRLQDGDVSVVLYERHQVVSIKDAEVHEIPWRNPDNDDVGPSI